jgi:hypothetical protein
LHINSSREGTRILALEVIAADAQTSTETWETMHIRGEICD